MQKLISLALSSLLMGAVSCQKQATEPSSPTNARLTAQQIYQQQRSMLPQTKSADLSDLVRPMPGDFSPSWADAREAVATGVTYVDVPISSAVGYTAQFPCAGDGHADHGVGAAEHNHHASVVTQQLSVVMGGDSAACYIVNIVPFEECSLTAEALKAGFSSVTGMDGFTGFAAYHNFDGSLVRVDGFEGGVLSATALPSDNLMLSTVTRNAQLYVANLGASGIMARYTFPISCDICNEHCGSEYDNSVRYSSHGSVIFNQNQDRRSRHCMQCSKLSSKCHCPNGPTLPKGPMCKVCGVENCTVHLVQPDCGYCGIKTCSRYKDPRETPENLHRLFLLDQFGSGEMPYADLHDFQIGCYYVDQSKVRSGDEYLHNFRLPTETYDVAYNKLRNYFISVVKEAKSNTYTYMPRIGEAMHPVLDFYIPADKRMQMLGYYSYVVFSDIIPKGALSNKVRDTRNMYNAIQALPQYPSEAQVAPIFDAWATIEF